MRTLLRLLGRTLALIALVLLLLLIWLWPRDPYLSAVQPDFELRKHEQPIVHVGLGERLTALATAEGGPNISGPSVIEVPAWVEAPLGKYYLYFAHHKGDYIRLAYADQLTGPWRIHEPGTLTLRASGFPVEAVPLVTASESLVDLWRNYPVYLVRDAVLAIYQALVTDQQVRQQRGIEQSKSKTPHIASPDVVIDEQNQRFVMFFHGQRDTLSQTSGVAMSRNGIDFKALDQGVPGVYLRSFKWRNHYYLLGAPGMIMRSDHLLGPYEVRSKPLFTHTARHAAVQVDGDRLKIVWSRVGDAPEHILYSELQLGDDWNDWRATAGVSVLIPEYTWEGVDLPVEYSIRGEMRRRAQELRDPFWFASSAGKQALFYVAGGEQLIGLAQIGAND